MSETSATTAGYMPLNLQNLFPLRSVIITLRFLEPSQPKFFHQAALTAFLRYLLDSPDDYAKQMYIDAIESGRTSYQNGDLYRFQVFFLDGTAERPQRQFELINHLIQQLNQLPHSAKVTDKRVPFCNNLALHSIQDGFMPEQPLYNAQQCSALEWSHIIEEACLWQEQSDLHTEPGSHHSDQSALGWQWLSPTRVLKPKDQRISQDKEEHFCRDLNDLNGSLLLGQVYDTYSALLHERGIERKPRPAPPAISLLQGQVFWLSNHYKDANKNAKSYSGIMGQLMLADLNQLDISWWALLIAGQYLGIGQQRAFGLGRYQLMRNDGASSYRRPSPTRPLIDQIANTDNLKKALDHVRKNSRSTAHKPQETDDDLPYWSLAHDVELEQTSDAPEPQPASLIPFAAEQDLYEQEDDLPLERLQAKCQQIAAGDYQAPTLNGWLIQKTNGGIRPLAVPPFQDRVLQRAVAQILTPAFEHFMHSDSYGYRPGRSRLNAMESIRQAIQQGYCWVYESDLKDFFDSVDLEHLAVRLYTLLGNDPIVAQLIDWMSADVLFAGEHIPRNKGLPQGSPLSPLLANLMLDDFDQDMQHHGFKLIRFADDFVVLCKQPEEAKRAHMAAQHSLQEHGLALNAEKTQIKPIEEGFRFLGYLFLNDLALDVGGERASPVDAPKPPTIPENSWLAHLSEHTLHQLTGEESEQDIAKAATPAQATSKIGERDETGTVLAITGAQPCTLYTRQNRLQVERDDQLLINMPWRHIQAVVLFGNHHITTPAIKTAMSNDVSIHLATGMGTYQGTCWNGSPAFGENLWLQQKAAWQEPDTALTLAKSLVKARIHHCTGILKRRDLPGTKQLSTLAKELHRADDLTRLNGYEGAAARVYFQALTEYLPPEFQFVGRNRRPPKDPFNVMLSLGYTLLYGYIDSLIRVSGLMPTIGFYHQPHGRHSGLASDLMEPFRHIVERTALAMVRKGQIKISDFETTDSHCTMAKKAVRKYLAELTSQFETPQPIADNYKQQQDDDRAKLAPFEQEGIQRDTSNTNNTKDKRRLTDLILQQNYSLKRFITHGEDFLPWRQR